MPQPQRILFLRGGALGDFLLTLPAIRAVREAFPAAHLSLLASPAHGNVARWLGLADEIRDLDSAGFAPCFDPKASLSPDWQTWLAQHDTAISWLHDSSGTLHRRLGAHIPAVHRGIPRPEEPGPHAIHQLSAVLTDLHIPPLQPDRPLALPGPVPPADCVAPMLAVHPGSGSPRKNWPAERWAELLTHPVLRSRWRSLLLISGEAERESGAPQLIAQAATSAGWQVQRADSLPLPDLAMQLAACRHFCGHDSGISHLAGLLGLPGIALFGPGNADVWAPAGRIRVLHAPESRLDALPAEAVAGFLAAAAVAENS